MSNGGRIDFDIGFNTDVSGLNQARNILENFKSISSQDIKFNMTIKDNIDGIEDRLLEAREAATEFEEALSKAYNPKLGTLDFNKINAQIKNGTLDLQSMQERMAAIGPTGQKAFREAAVAMLSTRVEAQKTDNVLNKIATTFGNTIKWGISSSIMKNFSTSVQQAYGYVKDLDSSLNDIRIVSGQSAEQMDKFADKANKAAEALGASTTAYTKASLIYYQQGLSDSEVEERTNATIKMSNVLGESSKEVSSYMTAIWNNFDDGSTSLEHYGDVITALGANTASSAAEIAEGLEKFASVADTVGLSYEYATAALATVVAETRQSAEIVGTAFKTLFARIQDLELGNALDDGTTLGKYSQALEAVGINIKDQNGQLKDMNDILDEMGSKWGTLSKDQQVALAQTVAGTRQYTQLVALMDNWDKVQQNVSVADNADGTLQQQQEIYLESVEAHLQQLKTSWEDLYNSLLDSDAIKDLSDSLRTVVNLMTTFVDSIGGGKGVLLAFGQVATTLFSKNIASGITQVIGKVKNMSDSMMEMKAKSKTTKLLEDIDIEDEIFDKIVKNFKEILSLNIEISDEMWEQFTIAQKTYAASQSQKENYEEKKGMLTNLYTDMGFSNDDIEDATSQHENPATRREAREGHKKRVEEYIDEQTEGLDSFAIEWELTQENIQKNVDKTSKKLEEMRQNLKDAEAAGVSGRKLGGKKAAVTRAEKAAKEARDVQEANKNAKTNDAFLKEYLDKVQKFKKMEVFGEEDKQTLEELETKIQKVISDGEKASEEEIGKIQEAFNGIQEKFNDIKKKAPIIERNLQTGKLNDGGEEESQEKIDKIIDAAKIQANVQTVTQLSSAFMGLSNALSTVLNLPSIWKNEDLSLAQKMIQTTMALTSATTMAAGAIGTLTQVAENETVATIASNVAKALNIKANFGLAASEAAVLWPLTLIIIALGALVASIIITVAAINAIIKAYNSAATAAKEASEHAKAAAEEYKNLRSAYEDLKSSFEDYQEAYNSIEKLRRGTQEWKDAIEECNNKTKEMLSTYPQLLQYAKYDNNGVLTISEEGQKEYLEKQQEKIDKAYSTMLTAQINSNEASYKSNKVDLRRSARDENSFVVASNVTGALTGDIADTIAKNIAANTIIDKNIDTVVDAVDKLGPSIFSSSKIFEDSTGLSHQTAEELYKALNTTENIAKIQQMVLEKNNADSIYRQLAEEQLKDTQTYKDLQSRIEKGGADGENAQMELDELISASGKQIEIAAQSLEAQKSILGKLSSDFVEKPFKTVGEGLITAALGIFLPIIGLIADGFIINDIIKKDKEEEKSAYAKLKGWDNVTSTSEKKGNVTFNFDDGTSQVVSRKNMQSDLILNSAALEANKTAEAKENLANKVSGENKALSDFITYGNFMNTNNADKEKISSEIKTDYKGNYEKYLIDKYGENGKISEDTLKAFGVDNTKQLAKNFEQNLTNELENSLDNVVKNGVSDNISSFFTEDSELGKRIKDMSTNEQSAVATAYQNAFEANGRTAVESLDNLYAILDDDDINDFTNAINSVDWETTDIDSLREQLASAGVEADFSDEALAGLIATMRDGTPVIKDVGETYKNLHDIIDGLKQGDTIEDEKYQTLLEKAGSDISEYFMTMADGTHKLIGDADDFYNVVNQKSVEQLKNNIDTVDRIKNSGYTLDQLKENKVGYTPNGDSYKNFRQTQFDFLDSVGWADESEENKKKIAEWKDLVEQGKVLSNEAVQEIGDAIQEYSAAYDSFEEMQQESKDQLASTATNISELDTMLKDGSINIEAYMKSFTALDNAERMEDLDSEEISEYADYLQDLSESEEDAYIGADKLSDELKDNEAAAKSLAIQIQRMNKGVEDLSNNWDEWSDILKKSSKGSDEYFKASKNTKKAMSDLLDVSEDMISNDFVESLANDSEALALMEKAAEGDGDAIDSLKDKLLEDIVANIIVDNQLDSTEFTDSLDEIQSQLNDKDLKVGATIDDASFLEACNDMIASSHMTASQVEAMFDAMGFEANFETVEEPVTKTGHETITVTEPMSPISIKQPDGSIFQIPEGYTTKTYTGAAYSYTDYVEVPALSTDGSSPKITSVTKKASGSANNTSSSNKGGKKGSGGGGGGGSKNKKEYKADRYHQINDTIKELTNNYDKLSAAQDKLLGADLVSNLQKQNDVLKSQLGLYAKKLDMQKEELEEKRQLLEGYGGTFNSDGNLNYNDFMAKITEEYNNSAMDEAAEKHYEEQKEAAERYHELMTSELADTEKNYQDTLDKITENNINMFNTKIKIQLDLNKAQRTYNKWYNSIVDDFKEDSPLGKATLALADANTYSKGKNSDIQATLTQVEKLNKEFATYQKKGQGDYYGDKQAKLYEDLQSNAEQLMTSMQNFKTEVQNAYDAYLSAIDQIKEKLDSLDGVYENITKSIDHSKSLAELLFGDKAYKSMNKYYKQSIKNGRQQVAQLKSNVDYWEKLAKKAKKAGDTEAYEKYIEQYNSALDSLNSAVESSINNIIDSYANSIQDILNDLNTSLSEGLTLDEVKDEWELIHKASTQYLDDVNKIFEITKLQSKFQKEIDKTTSVKNQQKLTKIMNEQVKLLEKKAKINEYDVKMANLRYELAVKEMALEDAKNNKNKMTLRRDAEGNYTYNYVANEGDVAQAQDDLDTVRNNLYNTSKDRLLETQQNFNSTWEEWQNKIAEIMKDNNRTEEEKDELIASINEKYQEILLASLEGNKDAINDLIGEVADVYKITEEEAEAMLSDLIPELTSSSQKMIDNINEQGIDSIAEDMAKNIANYSQTYEEQVQALLKASGQSLEKIANGTDSLNKNFNEQKKYWTEQTTLSKTELTETQKIATALKNRWDKFLGSKLYTECVKSINTAQKNLGNKLNGLDNIESKLTNINTSITDGAKDITDGIKNIKISGGGSSGGGGGGNTTPNDYKGGGVTPTHSYTITRTGPDSFNLYDNNAKKLEITNAGASYVKKWLKDEGYTENWDGSSKTIKFKTGGYTGEWNNGSEEDNGRLAFLHQKELVLNEEDTANILSAVDIIRQLQTGLDSSIQNIVRDAFSQMAKATFNTQEQSQTQCEQNVFNITQEFPNVTTDIEEVKEAILSLPNVTSQYINR